MLTVREVADRLRLSRFAVYDLIRARKLPAINYADEGKRPNYRILESEVNAFIERRQV